MLNWQDPSASLTDYLVDWQNVVAQGTTGPPTFSAISGLPGGGGKWCGGVLAPNGKIYGIPSASSDVLVIDPATGTATPVNMGAVDSACGGVLAPNGKIYTIPEWITGIAPDQGRVVEIDPSTSTAVRVGSPLPTTVGDTNYHGGVLAPNGDLYIIPAREPRVIRYDLDAMTATAIGTNYGTTAGRKWGGGVLGPDGKIYSAPCVTSENRILVIDPATDTTSTITVTGVANMGWLTGGLGWNGKIYFAPDASDGILELDPSSGTYAFYAVTGLPAGTGVFSSFALGADGMLYSAPDAQVAGNDRILQINPGNPAASQLLDPGFGTMSWDGLVTGPNGKIYFIPAAQTNVLVIDVHAVGTLNLNTLLSPYFNKL